MAEAKDWSYKEIGLKGERLDISGLVGRQLDRVLQSLGMGKEEFFNQLEGLEAACELMGLDDKYNEELEEINESFKEDWGKLRNSRYSQSNQAGRIMVKMAMKRFKAITRAIRRSGISPQKEIDLILE